VAQLDLKREAHLYLNGVRPKKPKEAYKKEGIVFK